MFWREEKLKILCDKHDVMKIRCDFWVYLSCFDHVENDDEWWARIMRYIFGGLVHG